MPPRTPARSPISLLPLLTSLPRLVKALPAALLTGAGTSGTLGRSAAMHATSENSFYSNLSISALLVILGGIFAGLTLGLMGQDEIYLTVIATSGTPHEQYHAKRVLKLIAKGKHWVLVTLLLSNVITNETLPIVLDSILGGGWPAVVASTVSIVIFGEVIPQSLCVRYGLQIGSVCAPYVQALMYLTYPVSYPIAALLDAILGEDHGTMYKRSGLKTLVTLHRTMGVERLNSDEVTIISAVLDLKEKPVGRIMTPIGSVFTMAADTILDAATVENLLHSGFLRIPVHVPGQPHNFIGMLLVRVLISYDPDDCLPVSLFPLASLPETLPSTSCLNILNYFQEGKSHMIVISERPGQNSALGVLTLEDVIEELIGEEIVDESDVYVDIFKAIKREHPGPLAKKSMTLYLHRVYNERRSSAERRTGNRLSGSVDEQGVTAYTGNYNGVEDRGDAHRVSNFSYGSSRRSSLDRAHPSQVIPGPNGTGEVHTTEEGAVAELMARLRGDELPMVFKTGNSGRHATSPEGVTGGATLPFTSNGTSSSHIYKTGGILESIINVSGVHKTIIANVDEDLSEESLLMGNLMMGSLNMGSLDR